MSKIDQNAPQVKPLMARILDVDHPSLVAVSEGRAEWLIDWPHAEMCRVLDGEASWVPAWSDDRPAPKAPCCPDADGEPCLSCRVFDPSDVLEDEAYEWVEPTEDDQAWVVEQAARAVRDLEQFQAFLTEQAEFYRHALDHPYAEGLALQIDELARRARTVDARDFAEMADREEELARHYS